MIPSLVLAAAFLHNLHYSWRKWGDLVVDSGRELEVAKLVGQGALLYRDVRHYYGPLAPYLDGALFALFGVHAGVLMAAGVASAAAMAVLLYLLARRLSDRVTATVVATAFLYLCAFGHYYFNAIFTWVLPYTYSATYAMLAATASLYLLVRYVQEGRRRDLRLSVAALALAALGKPEVFAVAAATHLTFVATERPRLGAYAAGAAATLAVFGVFWLALGPRLLDDYLSFALSAKFRPSLLLHMGLADWTQALPSLWASARALGEAVLLLLVLALVQSQPWMPAWGVWVTGMLGAAGTAVVYGRLDVFTQWRVLPFLLAVLLAQQVAYWWRAGTERRLALPHLLMLVFALASLGRTPLTTGAFHYGFYLLPVPLLAFGVFWFRYLPGWLPGRPTRLAAACGVGLFAAVVFRHYQTSRALYDRHNTVVRTPRGAMCILDDLAGFPVGRAYADTVQLLSRYPPETRVLVIPEGVGLTFMSGLTSVCGMHSFMPQELDGPFEDRLLACLTAAPPDLVVRVGLNLGEQGSRGFGEDYAQKVATWIVAHYEPLAQIGPGGYVLVLRRHPA